MKKVLSVLLAAAMACGMAVSSFAANYTWGTSEVDTGLTANDIVFEPYVNIVNTVVGVDSLIPADQAISVYPGSDLYFPIDWNHVHTNACCSREAHNVQGGLHSVANTLQGDCVLSCGKGTGAYTGKIDKDWSINISGDKYVVKASFVCWTPAGYSSLAADMAAATPKFVKVEIVDDLDSTSTVDVDFNMYIADNSNNSQTNIVTVDAAVLGNERYFEVKWIEENINDADEAATWQVTKNEKGTAVFDFEDDVYFTVKMVSEEKVTLNLSTDYDKAIDKLFDYEADLEFYNFKGTKDAFTKTGELFIPADEDTFIYEVVDGELVEIDATWTDEYTVTEVNKEYEGFVLKTNELGYYVVSDIEAEIEVEAEVEAEPEVEAEKANPETGAADFVGAAVAMAVVSVAAAGALALKK